MKWSQTFFLASQLFNGLSFLATPINKIGLWILSVMMVIGMLCALKEEKK